MITYFSTNILMQRILMDGGVDTQKKKRTNF